jgi:hypothetical protein
MTWFIFVLINQAKYYAQDTGNQYSIFGRLICLPDCDKTSENESGDITGTVVGRTDFKAQTVFIIALLTSSTSFFSWGK